MKEKETLKAVNPLSLFEKQTRTDPALKAFISSITLSYRYRKGWLGEGRDIPKEICETVAEHVMGMILLDEIIQIKFPEYYAQFDAFKIFKLIKRHELCEIHGEDFTPADKLSVSQKNTLEKESLSEWLELLPEKNPIMDDWFEYQEAKTAEAKYVHVLDYMQRSIRARVYEVEFPAVDKLHVDLPKFYENRKDKIPEPLLAFFETCLGDD